VTTSDPARLVVLLQRARWRVRTATVGSPEWDAAVEGLGELERELRRTRREARREDGARAGDSVPAAG
jgi:hypothetical protein